MKKTLSLNQLHSFAKEILLFSKNIKVFVFNGDLGTGKTTFIKQICKELGVKDQTSSPTYSIVNEYIVGDEKVYHIDLYRLNSLEEAFEIGIEEYLDSGNYCFIEWANIIEEILPDEHIIVDIEITDKNNRTFSVSVAKF